jgi:hypothetical protein
MWHALYIKGNIACGHSPKKVNGEIQIRTRENQVQTYNFGVQKNLVLF